MPKASVKRLIVCKKNQLLKLVLDIEKYPQFVPFCIDAKIYEKKDDGKIIKIILPYYYFLYLIYYLYLL